MRISMRQRPRLPILLCAIAALSAHAAPAQAQNRGAVQTKKVDPVYPEALFKTERQGNVLLAGRIDTKGRVVDVRVVAKSNNAFVQAALDAVKQWEFRPATRDGKPIEIFANIGVRFRIQNDKRGAIDMPILGDIAISPADAAGKATAPEGFPIQRGKDAALRAQVWLDLPPLGQARTLTVKVEAVSSSGRRISVFQPPVAVAAGATEAHFPVVEPIGKDWEDGVWALQFTVNGLPAGGGQFWLAADPAHFRFVIPAS
jgi:TonB family protein